MKTDPYMESGTIYSYFVKKSAANSCEALVVIVTLSAET